MRSPGHRVSSPAPAGAGAAPPSKFRHSSSSSSAGGRNVVAIMAKVAVGTGGVAAAVLVLVLMNLAPPAESHLPKLLWGAGEQRVYTQTHRSQSFKLGPGEVADQVHRITMPPGHIAVRSLDAQVVDNYGFAVPLHETYIHHWMLKKYYLRPFDADDYRSTRILVPNDGPCPAAAGIPQWFGLGSETRRTNTTIPSPYAIVTGDPDLLPAGFEEVWILDLKAIDTRGAVDPKGCAECRCELYNVTMGLDGNPLPESYHGGAECCVQGSHCVLEEGYEGIRRPLFIEYTFTWVKMDMDVVPLRIYVLDVTDSRLSSRVQAQCEIEYDVPQCVEGDKECVHTKVSTTFLPGGGEVVYAVAHQRAGGIGAALYRQDGSLICDSRPIYGTDKDAGNEDGYIVGMTSCHPEPGSLKLRPREKISFASFYNSTQEHAGAAGLFYVLMAPHHKSNYAHKREEHLRNGMILGSLGVIFLSGVVFGLTVCRRKITSYVAVSQSEP